MKPAAFDYVVAESVEAAVAALAAADGEAKIIAGGQSLVPMLNFRLLRPSILVDINRIPNLAYIEEQAADLGFTRDQVHFLGFVSRQDVISLYHNAFAMIYPSFFGPDNIPPIEAFGLGCPVIAADVPGADEQLGDAALRFDPRDENAFALSIKRLYEEPDLRTVLIEKGKRRAREWTAKHYVDKALTHIDALAPIRRCWSKTEPYRDPFDP